jgi:amidase
MVIPISEHQDTIGPMARTVKDAAYILQAIAGVDPYDNYTSAIPNEVVPDFIAACNLSALSGSRLGIPRNVIPLHPLANLTNGPIMDAFEQALGTLREAGATIVEDTNFTAAAEFRHSNASTEVISADFLVNLHDYFESLTYNPRNITSLSELRDFTQSFPLEDYPTRDTADWDQVLEQNWNNTDPRFWPAYQENLYYGGEGGLLGSIERHDLDAVILPTILASKWAAIIGSPIVTVPLGSFPDGVPVVEYPPWNLVESAPNIPYVDTVSQLGSDLIRSSRFGISFLGARFTDEKLIGLAYAFEQRTIIRDKVQPYLTPSIELVDVVENTGCMTWKKWLRITNLFRSYA